MANTVKKTAAKKKVAPKKVTTTKTVKKPVAKTTTKKKFVAKKFGMENKKYKDSKFTLVLTIIGIFACLACAIMDKINGHYYNMPLYAILLFIIIVEDKK